MINIILYKEEYNILLSYRELDEFRYDKDRWFDVLYEDDKYQYLVDLYVTDKVAEQIMYFVQETENNIFNNVIHNVRNQFQKLIDEKQEYNEWYVYNFDEVLDKEMINNYKTIEDWDDLNEI